MASTSGLLWGDISLEEFLRDYWQQKPLLMRNAIPGFTSPLSPDELAGLACEDGINSRLVIEDNKNKPWTVEYGPFEDEDFARLPETHWSLLVSDIEKHVPETQSIIALFNFIPDWRIDDLMMSYAPEHGSVGPHVDAYDVFLLQAHGRRKWMISHSHCNRFLPDSDLKILAEFTPDDEWILEPGDILYLPPGIAHHGVAVEPCMTCSIGFRAPSLQSMISEFGEYLSSTVSRDLRYTDKNLEKQSHPAEISPVALNKIKQQLDHYFKFSDQQLETWFGEYMTDIRSIANTDRDDFYSVSYEQVTNSNLKDSRLVKAPASRFLFIRHDDRASLFVDGKSYTTSLAFCEHICAQGDINIPGLLELIEDERDRLALTDILDRGCLGLNHD